MTETVDEFYGRVRTATVAALEHGATTIEAIVDFTSVLPTEIRAVLDQMESDHIVVRRSNSYQLADQRQPTYASIRATWVERRAAGAAALDAFRARLHLPHCLDYEWWFALDGIEAVAETVFYHGRQPLSMTVACLGAPSVAVYLAAAIPEIHVIALDRSTPTIDAITACALGNVDARTYDVRHRLPPDVVGVAQTVFCDPPWYVDYYHAFLTRCTELMGAESVLVTILFPPLTRPNAQFERDEILRILPDLGLHLEALHPLSVLYDTPPFEAALLPIRRSAWRCGDLVVARLVGVRSPPQGPLTLDDAEWETVLVGRIKVMLRIRADEDVATMPVIRTLPDGPAIGSVSRRSEARNLIDLWTSTHLGYGASGWRILRLILEGIAAGATIASITSAASQLLERELRQDEREAVAVAYREFLSILSNAPNAATPPRDRHAAVPHLDLAGKQDD